MKQRFMFWNVSTTCRRTKVRGRYLYRRRNQHEAVLHVLEYHKEESMIRLKYTIIISAILVLLVGIFGLSKRNTYIDITKRENPLDELKVAIFTDDLIEIVERQEFADSYQEESRYIVKVQCDSGVEIAHETTFQYALVEEVYKGEGLSTGDRIAIVPGGGSLSSGKMRMLFVNYMESGKEYLVFLEECIRIPETKEIMYMPPGLIVTPVFDYDDTKESRSQPYEGDRASTEYRNVKEYEFFAESEEGLEALRDLKRRLMEPYL